MTQAVRTSLGVLRGRGAVAPLLLCAVVVSCSPGKPPFDRGLLPPAELGRVRAEDSPYLKAHMKDGRLYVLSKWTADGGAVKGTGQLVEVDRIHSRSGVFEVHFADVALFETNAPVRTSPALAAMLVVTGASIAVTVACILNPKACFGSCPTFYVTDGKQPVLQAEGFSDSVAPSLEATDVDALYRARPAGRNLEVRMTNEALETHVVKRVEVIAVPRPPGGRVFYATDDGYYGATALAAAESCDAPEGSCAEALRTFDGHERTSLADGRDLGTKEELTLTFPPSSATSRGLVIAARQTLLTTYLLYQELAYLGSKAVDALSQLERDPRLGSRLKQAHRLLGSIEIAVQGTDGRWEPAGEVFETGPIATDVHLVRLPAGAAGPLHVRLRLTRGNWRLDWVGLADLGPRLEPTVLPAKTISGVTDDKRHVTARAGETIVTLPGDAYNFEFELPEHPEKYELFLSSRGYYLEWIRERWLAEESPARAALMMYAPSVALRLMAPAYKQQEAGMERLFWESRYAHP